MSFGQSQKFKFDLTDARTGSGPDNRSQISGKKIQVTGASSASALAQVSIIQNGYSPNYDLIDQAYIYDDEGFSGFFLTNEAQPGAWLEITVSNSNDDFVYHKPTTNNIGSIATPVKTQGGAGASSAVTVTTAATLLMAANANRTGWSVHNNSSQTIYIGGAAVDTAGGFPVLAGEKYGEDGTEAVYAIVAATTSDVRVREIA